MEPAEIVDRLALRDLVDAYARCADRRTPEEHGALFAEDGRLVIHNPATSPEPQVVRVGREPIAKAMTGLNRYTVTTHLVGQHTVTFADGDRDRATGEAYCLAHHVSEADDGTRSLYVMAIRYLDEYVRSGTGWLFQERRLAVDWTETRPL